MFKPLSAYIGFRYTRAKRDNHFVSFISLASVFGILLGVMVLITVLSVINGYEKGMRDRYLGMLSHITVSEAGWQLPNWQQRRDQVLQTPGVKAAAPFIEKQVMLKEGLNVRGAMLEAVLPAFEKDIGTLSRYIAEPARFCDLKAGENNIILGETLAKKLGVERGDSLTLLSPKPVTGFDSGEQQIPLLKEFNVVGTFKVDMQQYDSTTAYIHLDDARELFDMDDLVTGLRVQLDDIYQAPDISEAIAAASTGNYIVTNWTTSNQNFFKAIQLQKTMLFLVLVLIIAIAAFNLVSTLIMVVTDKESDIAILRTLGMSPAQVMRVFIVQGSLLGITGTVLGVILGLLLASNVGSIVPWLEQLFNTHFLQAEVHGITHVDARIETLDVVLIAMSALVLSVLATLFPAWKASRVQPAESLRYE
jgi:lipoprotein-releasing system permease protein